VNKTVVSTLSVSITALDPVRNSSISPAIFGAFSPMKKEMWSTPGSSTYRAPGTRSARNRPPSTLTTASSVQWITTDHAVHAS
jgi:hypothetical protein